MLRNSGGAPHKNAQLHQCGICRLGELGGLMASRDMLPNRRPRRQFFAMPHTSVHVAVGGASCGGGRRSASLNLLFPPSDSG